MEPDPRLSFPLFTASNTRARGDSPSSRAHAGTARRHFLRVTTTAALAIVTFAIGPAAIADQGNSTNQHWVATWATSPAAYFVYAAPIPQNQALEFSTTKSAVANIQ